MYLAVCHAWSALPMYEIMRTMVGVVSKGIGWEHVRIRPNTMDLEDLQGKAATPKGDFFSDMRRQKEYGII